MADTRPISGPCPLCGGLIRIPAPPLPELEPLSLPQPAARPSNSAIREITDSIPVGSLRSVAKNDPAPSSRRERRPVRERRRESAFAPGYFLLSLGLLGLLGFGVVRLSVPIRGWLEESPWTRDFFRKSVPEEVPEIVPDRRATSSDAVSALPLSAAEEGAWGALKVFLLGDGRRRAAMTLEGEEAMAAPFERLFGPEGMLEGGLPEPACFQISGDRELSGLLGPGWSVYESVGEASARSPRVVLAWARTSEGKYRVAGRLFLEIAENRLASFAAPGGDPASEREFLVRLRGRSLQDRMLASDPLAPVVELLPPVGETVVGSLTLAENDPMLHALGGDSIAPATVRLGRASEKTGGVKLLGTPIPGWPDGLTLPLPEHGGGGEGSPTHPPAVQVARAFLSARSERRLDYVNTRDNAMLIKELEAIHGGEIPSSAPLRSVEAIPLTAARAGAIALRVLAPTLDGEGACMLWLVPFAGSHKIEGSLWAQSYYGWFRRFLRAPVSSPRELRGLVFPIPEANGNSPRFRFRDVNSEAAVELDLPAGSPQAASLARIAPGQARHATLRLRWENGDTPRIVLDEWLCWGYRGIDEQSF